MICYATYIVSFRVHTLLWNSYCVYVIVYFAISDHRVYNSYIKISKPSINKCIL